MICVGVLVGRSTKESESKKKRQREDVMRWWKARLLAGGADDAKGGFFGGDGDGISSLSLPSLLSAAFCSALSVWLASVGGV